MKGRALGIILTGFMLSVVVAIVAVWSTAPDAAGGVLESSNPLSGDATAIDQGKTIYTENCTLCHGRKANGRTGRWQSADLTKFNKGFSRFVAIVEDGVKPRRGSNNKMPPWSEFLNKEQIMMIGAYLETLAIRGAKWADPSGTEGAAEPPPGAKTS